MYSAVFKYKRLNFWSRSPVRDVKVTVRSLYFPRGQLRWPALHADVRVRDSLGIHSVGGLAPLLFKFLKSKQKMFSLLTENYLLYIV